MNSSLNPTTSKIEIISPPEEPPINAGKEEWYIYLMNLRTNTRQIQEKIDNLKEKINKIKNYKEKLNINDNFDDVINEASVIFLNKIDEKKKEMNAKLKNLIKDYNMALINTI